MGERRYGHMVHEYYVHRLRAHLAERAEVLGAVTSKGAAEAYVRRVRSTIRDSFGPEPARTPLNPLIGGSKDYGRFSIEKISYESRPGLMVTGNLYLPTGLGEKAPAVLGLCGHSLLGKAEPLYQAFCQGLAAKGFVTFIIDPIDQGERKQFSESDGGALPGLCEGHNLVGNQQVLMDDFFGSWRAWDAIRGLDYLLSRPEVDPDRIGVTGNSGGGTLTSYVTALDPRITMAAPSCYICSYLANLENEIPADAEQNPPGILSGAFDEADLLLAFAPRPTLILSQIDDFFDERYARKAYEDVRRINEMLGAVGTVSFFAGPHGHGYHQENREAMYAFFMEHAGIGGDSAEPELVEISDKDLWVTPMGDTAAADSKRVFNFIKETAASLVEKRPAVSPKDLVRLSREILSVPEAVDTPHYRNLTPYRGAGRHPLRQSQYAVETEPGIQSIITTYGAPHPTMHPPKGMITVYVGHTDAEADIVNLPDIGGMVDESRSVVTIDPRGLGTAMTDTCNSDNLFAPYGSDYLYASTGEMLGESYLGRRIFDVVRSIDFLVAKGATDITLIGRGLGAVIAAFAALLRPAIHRVKLINYLPSFQLLTEDPLACWPLSSIPRGILTRFDLPDLYGALGEKIELTDPWDARMLSES